MRFAGALGDDDIPMGTYIIMPVYFLPGFLGDYFCGACDMLCSSKEADEKNVWVVPADPIGRLRKGMGIKRKGRLR